MNHPQPQKSNPQVYNASLSRRRFCQLLAGVTAGMTVTALGSNDNEPRSDAGDFNPGELKQMEAAAEAFMLKYQVPGLSLAIARKGRLVYARGLGLADKAKQERVTPRHLFRIASLSKPITSVTIFRLIEAGKLKVTDRVFGETGVLGTDYGKPPFKKHIEQITIEHLLTHTAGGWQNNGSDPMFSNPTMNHHQLIEWTIAHQELIHPPGQNYAYSNFGFCILGRVIEKLTGKAYADAVRDEVLTPCGIERMRISGNSLAERCADEVVYYGQDGQDPYQMNVRRMDSHGGWLATATDLVRFLVRVDGFQTKPDILRADTLKEMTTASAASATYAKGWCVNKFNNWWHTGSLPGSASVMVRTSHEFCWAALANTRSPQSAMNGDLDQLTWNMIDKIKTWPNRDLFSAAPQ